MFWRNGFTAMLVANFMVSLMAFDALATDVAAGEKVAEEIPDVGKETSSYCGIYCVYAALNGFGKRTDFVNLLQTKYVGTMFGSSIHELARAVEDHGLHAQPMMGLSRANLVTARTPIVLHVSQPNSPTHFGHWVLFLGMEDGQAKVLDVPHNPELMPVADLLARWDGVGLYISEQPLSPWQLKLDSLLTGENLVLVAALLLITTLVQRVMRVRRGAVVATRPTGVAAAGLLLTAGLTALAWHVLSADGYARNQVAIRTVIQQHRPSFLPKLDVPDMERALQDKSVVIVDARYPRDYQAGHLPGAINVPIFTTQVERRRLLGSVPKNARVIVYCQSDSCEFDESLGSMLVAEGIENVSLFPGGWAKWKTDRPKDAADDNGNGKPNP
ncbi:MAG: hypothetical protein JSS49_09420 [Planctomycetes bacterium]|nr:hypothetical protein [Planctomycetota bacterium]